MGPEHHAGLALSPEQAWSHALHECAPGVFMQYCAARPASISARLVTSHGFVPSAGLHSSMSWHAPVPIVIGS